MLRWLAVIFAVAVLGVFLWRTAPVIGFPYEIKYGESVVVDQSRRVFSEIGLYPPFEEPPYLIGNYPPVYPMILAALPESSASVFAVGRLISTLAVLISAALVLLIVRTEVRRADRWQRDQWVGRGNEAPRDGIVPGVLAAAVFLALPEIQEFGVLARVDMVGLAFGLGGFLLARPTANDEPDAKWRPYVAGALFFLAVYSRHSLIGLPVVAYAANTIESGRRALIAPAALLGAGIAAFLIGFMVTGGGLYDHLIFLNQLPYDSDDIATKWLLASMPWRTAFFAVALASVAVLGLTEHRLIAKRRETADARPNAQYSFFGVVLVLVGFVWVTVEYGLSVGQWAFPTDGRREASAFTGGLLRLIAVWFVALGGVALLSLRNRELRVPAIALVAGSGTALFIGRAGSDINYLFEFYALGAIGLGIAGAMLVPKAQIVVAVLAIGITTGSSLNYEPLRTTRQENLDEIARIEPLIEFLRDHPGRILSNDPSVPVILGRPLEYQPFMYRKLHDSELWDARPLTDAVTRRDFAAVVQVGAQPYSGMRVVDGVLQPVFEGGIVASSDFGFPKKVTSAVLANYEFAKRRTKIVTPKWARVTAVYLPKK